MNFIKRGGAYTLGLTVCVAMASIAFSAWWLYQPPQRTGLLLLQIVLKVNVATILSETVAAAVAGAIGYAICWRIPGTGLRLALLTVLATALVIVVASFLQAFFYGSLELFPIGVTGYVHSAVPVLLLATVALWSVLFEQPWRER